MATSSINMELQRFADPVGLLSAGTKLGYKPTGGAEATFTDIPVITASPEIGSEPERVDVTTLADWSRRYIAGIKDQDNLTFPAVYRKEVYEDMYAAEIGRATFDFKLTFPDQTGFTWSGQVATTFSGAEINGALMFNIIIVPSTEVVHFSAV